MEGEHLGVQLTLVIHSLDSQQAHVAAEGKNVYVVWRESTSTVVELLKVANGYLPRVRLEYNRCREEKSSLQVELPFLLYIMTTRAAKALKS
jgi:hypothetical protein